MRDKVIEFLFENECYPLWVLNSKSNEELLELYAEYWYDRGHKELSDEKSN